MIVSLLYEGDPQADQLRARQDHVVKFLHTSDCKRPRSPHRQCCGLITFSNLNMRSVPSPSCESPGEARYVFMPLRSTMESAATWVRPSRESTHDNHRLAVERAGPSGISEFQPRT
ncbi:hypothetical protein JOD27_007554 [Lentzea nigeriaca]|nr:hypothetical protein [Lentzea nigeriaca]